MTKYVKWLCALFIVGIISVLSIAVVNAFEPIFDVNINISSSIDPDTNFFGEKENKELVNTVSDADELTTLGYEKVSENSDLGLYLDRKTMGIAIFDKNASYIWYSCYKNYKTSGYTDAVKEKISSGVTLECYDSSTLNELVKYSSTTKDCTMTYKMITNGFSCNLNFKTVGISFDIEVKIDGKDLIVDSKMDTLEEVEIQTAAMKFPKQYKLKAITVFPYLGSENYEINGYSFIPDGSGALIRFTDVKYDTAFIKRIYGDDLGIQNNITSTYLKNKNNITMPVYGINHGYNQAAFLAEIVSGYGSSELHSYPYMYENLNLNRTFFKFIGRDKFNIQMSSSTSGSITLINSDVYNDNYTVKYHFLNNSNASYSGMANEYKKNFNLRHNTIEGNIPLKLDIVCQDYKKGLFGKNFITMTSYKAISNILEELNGINVELNLIGASNNGYFDNTLTKFKPDSSLGGKKEFNNLIDVAEKLGVDIYYQSNPMVATKNVLTKKTIKRTNLELFNYQFKSNLGLSGRIINPLMLDDYFLKYKSTYNKYSMKNFSFDFVGSESFAYRVNSNDYSREEMIGQMKESLDNILSSDSDYKIALSKVNDYLFNDISCYYDTNVESSKYAFITDSIPFVSLVLSGDVNLYSSNINFVSDYMLFSLRLIEYNIYPSFILTEETSSLFRYTNFEYLYTTEYKLWKNKIQYLYDLINTSLKEVVNAKMIEHYYIESGVSITKYDNGKTIIVNYNDEEVNIGTILVPPYSSRVGGDI